MKSKLVPFDLVAVLPPTEERPSKLLSSIFNHMATDATAAVNWFRVELATTAAGSTAPFTREEVEAAVISARAFPVPA